MRLMVMRGLLLIFGKGVMWKEGMMNVIKMWLECG
jgi:hypothetical protein